MKFRRLLLGALVAATASAALLPGMAQAQNNSGKILKFIVPYAPGGLPDAVARVMAQRMQQNMGMTVVVENRSGANGAVAAAAISNSPNDGSVLLVTDGSMFTINPLTISKLAYDPVKDFTPVSLIASSPLFLAVPSSLPVSNLSEFISYAKSRQGELNYGSSGIGSSHHLSMEALKSGLGLDMTHIPFRGSGASVPALVGGQVEVLFSAYPSMAGFAREGKIRLIATNSATRSALAPDVPAISEKIPGFDFAVRVMAMAPKGTPADAIQRLAAEFAKAAQSPEVIEKMRAAGVEMIGGSPAQLAKALDDERARMAAAAKVAKLEAQ